MNSKIPIEGSHIPMHTQKERGADLGPFVTAVFTVSNGDIHKSLDYPQYMLNNNHISFINENGIDKSKPHKSNIKKSALADKRHIAVELPQERKSVSFTDDTLDNENTIKVLRKERHEQRRKQRLKPRRLSPTNPAYRDDKEEEIEQSLDFDSEQTESAEIHERETDVTPQTDGEKSLSNGHVAVVANGGLARALVDLDITDSDLQINQSSAFRPEESLDSTDFSSPISDEFVYFDKMVRSVVSAQRRKKNCVIAGVIFALVTMGVLGVGLALYFLLPT